MKRMIWSAAVPAFLALAATPVVAAAPAWTVSEVSGDVRLTTGGQTRPASRGALLASGATITTAPKARAVIVRGGEFVVISPGTRIRVPEDNAPNKIMQLIEDWGSALFKIEKKSTPHFGVQTPYLAAVVKGTTFTVTVGPEGGQVRVSEGAVQVTTLDGADSELIPAGGAAMVGKSNLYRLSVERTDGKPVAAPNGRAVGQSGASNGAPASSPAQAPAWSARGGRSDEVRIGKAIREKKVDLSQVTGGLVASGRGAELAQGEFNEHSRRAAKAMRPDQPDGGTPDKPDKDKPKDDGKPDGGKPDQGKDKPDESGKPKPEDKPDKPEKDEMPGKEDQAGKDEKNGKDDLPAQKGLDD